MSARALTFALSAAALTAAAHAQTPSAKRPKETPGALRAAARISLDSARVVALARVPGGAVREGELEREHGRLIYSFDITVPGRSGVEEVQVSALDGRVVSQTHESPAKEAAEANADAKTRAKAAQRPGRAPRR